MAKTKTKKRAARTPARGPSLGQRILKGIDEATRHFRGEDVGARETVVTLTPLQLCVRQLREARTRAGLTLAQVAEKSGVRLETVSRLEMGRYKNPTIDTLQRVAGAVGAELTLSLKPAS